MSALDLEDFDMGLQAVQSDSREALAAGSSTATLILS